ncbi:GIY-YIG nuclease family protein [Mesorhizobium sp. M1334]|uniref:GIY-YIG nuclease family protein n=1 Tax=Mesorhizobium sp. M1334 TaxID=2957084 RepID=UPI00333D2286
MTEATKSFIYIATAEHGGLKVGYSTNPVRRLVAINRRRHIGAKIAHVVETDHPQQCEFLAHRALKTYRLDGEWFSCPLAVAIEAVESASRAVLIPDTRVPVRVFRSGKPE